MSIMISIKLTQRLGFWIDLDLTRWIIETHNYCSFSEGQCMSYTLGPLSMGCNYPNAAGEAELNAYWDRAKEELHGQKQD